MSSTEIFWSIGHKITGHDVQEGSISLGYRKFRAFFGTSPIVCVAVWDILFTVRPRDSTPEHLLWALMLLKRYCIESFNAGLVGVSEKTFRKWSHIFIRLLANMPVVSYLKKKSATSKSWLIQFHHWYKNFSLTGSNVFEMLQEMHPHLFLLMELTLGLWNQQSLIPNGGHTNSRVPVCVMRLEFVFVLETLFGLTAAFLAANGQIFDLLEMQFWKLSDQEKRLWQIVVTTILIILTFPLEMRFVKENKYWRGMKL